ncbi:hypothetical protein pb186bvf_001650 [Paramecium bursaria]
MEDISYSNNKISSRKTWTTHEDNLMSEAIKIYGHNWIQISNYIGSRNASQCAQRLKRIKNKQSKKTRFQWSEPDQKKLVMLFKEYGQNWQVIAEMFGDRTSRQVREKFTNDLNPKLKQVPWTQEEDQLIYELFLKHGCKWTSFTKQLPKRSERMIKNRFYTKLRYTHLGLPNAYQEVNFIADPYQQLQEQRLKILEKQGDFLNINKITYEDISQFLNLTQKNDMSTQYDTQ